MENIDSRYTSEDFNWRDEAASLFANVEKASGFYPKWHPRYDRHLFWEFEKDGKIEFIDNQINYSNQYHLHGMSRFKGMYCCQGAGLISINPSGFAKNSICSFASRKYNIYNDNPYKYDDFIINFKCPSENCGCYTNHLIPKFIHEKESNEFIRIYRHKL